MAEETSKSGNFQAHIDLLMMTDCFLAKRSSVSSLFLQIPISFGRVMMIVSPSDQPWTKLGMKKVTVMSVPIMALANDVTLLPRT